MKLNPLTIKKLRRFKSIRRGYYSFIALVIMIGVALGAELLVNHRALIVHYNGQYYFPTYGRMLPGTTFGSDYAYETNYRKLAHRFDKTPESGNWVLLPIVPYNPYENDFKEGLYPPLPPSFKDRHFLGVDIVGRDIAARLVYGFRIAILFSLLLLAANYIIGISIGSAMGIRLFLSACLKIACLKDNPLAMAVRT